jgi:imidazolonepropionase-like amidohydrolase
MRSVAFVVLVTVFAGALSLAGTARAADTFERPLGPVVALTHVRVIDGSGGDARDDQTIVIAGGRISAVGAARTIRIPDGASVMTLPGRTVTPGLVGMHDHLFYQLEPNGSSMAVPAQSTFAKLYLASGVTTIRTAGTLDFDADLRLKRSIDDGREPGPKIHLTGPYLGAIGRTPDPEAVARIVATYADRGATSFKAYTSMRGSELQAAVTAAHERGLKVTGHLCAVGFREAAALGIDNVEHGIAMDSELFSEKRPDECPSQWDIFGALIRTDVTDVAIRQTIETLVRRGIAVTSTLAVLESYATPDGDIDARVPPLLSARLRDSLEQAQRRRQDPKTSGASWWGGVLSQEMKFERAFVKAGGTLLAGADPTGWGAIVAGYGDQRGVELLVAAGFTPEQAIQIATSNGAAFLGERTIGQIETGRQADMVVFQGNVSEDVSAVRHAEIVFKDGVAYAPGQLVAAAAGTLAPSFWSTWTWPIAGVLIAVLIGRRAKRHMFGQSRNG